MRPNDSPNIQPSQLKSVIAIIRIIFFILSLTLHKGIFFIISVGKNSDIGHLRGSSQQGTQFVELFQQIKS